LPVSAALTNAQILIVLHNQQKQAKTEEQFDQEWREKYGEKGARIIRSAVDKCMPDYLYLKQFALKA
jgi:hypothetical protein